MMVKDPLTIYYRDISDAPRFTKEQEKGLHDAMVAGREARDDLIRSMLQFAVGVASTFREQALQKGIPFADLIGAANLALVHVVDSVFDPVKGRLITILRFHVRRDIERLLHGDDQTVKTPQYLRSSPHHRYRGLADRAGVGTVPMPRDDLLFSDDRGPLERICLCELVDSVKSKLGVVQASVRDKEMFLDWVYSRKTYREMGTEYGVSYQRVEQIIRSVGGKLKELWGFDEW